VIISSGADHEKVAQMNPHWSVEDWCWYWERDARKGLKKSGLSDPGGRLMDCGEECKCVR
jgi:hypothetical protein